MSKKYEMGNDQWRAETGKCHQMTKGGIVRQNVLKWDELDGVGVSR